MAEMLPLNTMQMRMQQNCNGCYYFSGWSCDYILIEKSRRPCRPGDECTVRKKRGTSREESLVVVSRARSQLPPKPAYNRDKKPYTAHVKHPQSAIKAAQTKAVKVKKPQEASSRLAWKRIVERLETPEVRQMYDAGASDAAIGQAVGCCASSVKKWRTQNGLPMANRRAPGQGMNLLFGRLAEIKADLAENKTDYELSLKYGVSQRTFGRFRIKYDLGPARGKRKEETQ